MGTKAMLKNFAGQRFRAPDKNFELKRSFAQQDESGLLVAAQELSAPDCAHYC
jgi:hypothetical protein